MKNFWLIITFISFISISVTAQQTKRKGERKTKTNQYDSNLDRPKLVVGIVVDQMRYDYLTKFWNHYGDGGFKKMINEGYNIKNAHYNYVPTYTGPGHASIYTGTSPSVHGIISNNWYDKYSREMVYCAGDSNYSTVGTDTKNGEMSPSRMKVTTVTDQLKMDSNMRAKTIGISIKDRGAILPAGHTADGAYWFDGGENGKFISSTFYFEELPKWAKKFNNSNIVSSYMKVWNTYAPIETYIESIADNNKFEGTFKGQENPVFPHDLPKYKNDNGGFSILKGVPYGNSIVKEFALAAVKGEEMGKDNITDFLAISFSSTDYVGHKYGVDSKEIQDTYVRLDRDIEDLLVYLDKEVGKDSYTVFLTADHAAVQVPSYLESIKVPAGYFESDKFKDKVNTFLTNKYGLSGMVENFSSFQIFLDYDKLKELKLTSHEVAQAIVDEVIWYEDIAYAYTAKNMHESAYNNGIELFLKNGYNQKRSGDVLLVLDPAVISYSRTGSTHGSGFSYDTHVPMLFYGKGINIGETSRRVSITDIAPTISTLLGIEFPSGVTGNPIPEVID